MSVFDEEIIEETNNSPDIVQYQWKNADNKAFYEHMDVNDLKEFVIKGGLDKCCDVELVMPYCSPDSSILEVGAGYGRVLNYLIDNGGMHKITCIERSAYLCDYLAAHYGDKANLLKGDLLDPQLKLERYDLILWLWSGMADFAPQEQRIIVNKLAKSLNKNGKIIIDTFPSVDTPLGMEKEDGKANYCLNFKGTTVHTYSASFEEVERYAKWAGLQEIIHLEYYTATHRKRYLHILS